jgi:hypothetical protein
MNDRLGIGRGLKDRTAALQPALQGPCIGDVAVMGDGETAARELGEERLHVPERGAAARGIPVVADRPLALEALHYRRIGEVVADQPEVALDAELLAVKADDARRLLTPMLERVQAESRQGGGVRMAENAENAALFMQRVLVIGRRQPFRHEGPHSGGVSISRSS